MRNFYLISGIILITIGLTTVFTWWDDIMIVLKGLAGVVIILLGAVALFIARKTK